MAATATTSSDTSAYLGNNVNVRIGYDTNAKIGFFGSTPVSQQTGYAALATTGSSSTATISEIQTDLNLIRTLLVNYGLSTTV